MRISDSVENNFKEYAIEVIQRRAIVDVCDGLKPSARQVMFSLFEGKMTHDKAFTSMQTMVGEGMKFYTHGR